MKVRKMYTFNSNSLSLFL